jgi:Ino eighty subunit 1
MSDGYDTDEESQIQALQQQDIEVGSKTPPPMFAGLVPLDYGGEVNDYGEECYRRVKVLQRVVRRLERWEGGGRSRVRARRGREWDGRNGHGHGNGELGGIEDRDEDLDDEDQDEDMQDIEEQEQEQMALERREREEMMDSDEEDEVYDRHTLPPLSSLGA